MVTGNNTGVMDVTVDDLILLLEGYVILLLSPNSVD